MKDLKISKTHIQPIIDWCYKKNNLKFHTPVNRGSRNDANKLVDGHEGPIWGFPKLNEMPLDLAPVPFPYSELAEIEYEILSKYRFDNYYRECKFGTILSYSQEGHQVHEHQDPAMMGQDYIHTRFNVLISKPEEGGMPILDGKELKVEELQVWMCFASEYLHSTTKVVGKKDRIMLSFGYDIHRSELTKWL